MKNNDRERIPQSGRHQATMLWGLTGLLLAYFLFFIIPVFLNPSHQMQFVPYISTSGPIGGDLGQMLSYSQSWIAKQSPYIGKNLYPPFAALFFAPLVKLDFAISYTIIVISTLLCYFVIAFLMPKIMSKERSYSALPVLLFASGLFSFGLQFELERGQFNVIACSLCLAAIYLYHYKPRLKYLAYALFTVSIQLKIYPAIFILMFISDWRNWKSNFIKCAGILSLNFGLLFILGYRTFLDFWAAIHKQITSPNVWIGNHSISSFVELLYLNHEENGASSYFADLGIDINRRFLMQYSWVFQAVLLASVLACLILIILIGFKRRTNNGPNPNLLLACTIGALVVPAVSNDYTLAILASPTVIFVWEYLECKDQIHGEFISSLLIGIILFAYSSTLFPYVNRPLLIQNNFPALMIILFAVAIITMLQGSNPKLDQL
jgi:Glycosyltransferase family 87